MSKFHFNDKIKNDVQKDEIQTSQNDKEQQSQLETWNHKVKRSSPETLLLVMVHVRRIYKEEKIELSCETEERYGVNRNILVTKTVKRQFKAEDED